MMSAGDLTISPGAGEVLGATAGAVDLARSVMVTTRPNLQFDISHRVTSVTALRRHRCDLAGCGKLRSLCRRLLKVRDGRRMRRVQRGILGVQVDHGMERERGEKDCTPMHPVHGLRGWMALEIDTLQCSVGVAAPRDARLRRGAAGQGGLGSPFRMSLPLVRSSAGDWGMSGRGSRVNG
jgi:hypothetical protein